MLIVPVDAVEFQAPRVRRRLGQVLVSVVPALPHGPLVAGLPQQRLRTRAVRKREEVVLAKRILLGAVDRQRRVRRRSPEVVARLGVRGVEVGPRIDDQRLLTGAHLERELVVVGVAADTVEADVAAANEREQRPASQDVVAALRVGRARPLSRRIRNRGACLLEEVAVIAEVERRVVAERQEASRVGVPDLRSETVGARVIGDEVEHQPKAIVKRGGEPTRAERLGGLPAAHEQLADEPVVGDRGLVVAAVASHLVGHLALQLAGRPASPMPGPRGCR